MLPRAASLLLTATLSTAWFLPQVSVAETVAQTLALASERHGEIFTVDYFDDQYVFINGLNEIWRVNAAGQILARGAVIRDAEAVYLLWQDGSGHTLDLEAELTLRFQAKHLPLAMQIKTITTASLRRSISALPKGVRFGPGGDVVSGKGDVLGTWSLSGAAVHIKRDKEQPFVIPAAELAQAMSKGDRE